jgi:hypothetical protein
MNTGFEHAVNNQVYLILVLINLSMQPRRLSEEILEIMATEICCRNAAFLQREVSSYYRRKVLLLAICMARLKRVLIP